ncbi:unannotated protein [freshwater metagenome]|uniref:Unannotated protein n=1 Tax=freshwater metagenome TaxID=449393 RepID=A0A6J6VLX2_9ZZZZ|nr:FHA domain-containing protein [Actinomycetota bacterium]
MTDAVPTPRTYLPGEWYAVLGPSLVLALPPDRRDLAAAAWAAVDAGAGAEELLDLVLASGLRDLAGLALVSTDGDRTRVLVRGQAVCLLVAGGEETVADGRGLTTWAEVGVDGVEAVSLELGPGSGGEPLLAGDALVRASRVLWPAESVPGPASGPAAPPSYAAGRLPGSTDPASEPSSLLSSPAPAVAVAAGSAPAPEPVLDPDPEPEPDTIDQAVPSVDDPVIAPVDEPGDRDEDALETAPFAGMPAAPAVPPVPEPWTPPAPSAPEPWSPGADDHDGRTQDGSWDVSEFQRRPHGIPGQPEGPSVTSRPVAVLQLSSGDSVEVDRVVILGRAPEARRFSATEQPRLVTVPSPQQEISSTHLEVRPGTGADHGSAVVTDLGSTNGTVLVQPGLPAESLKPGIPVQLLPGAVIDLGDGLSITVARP